MSQALMSELGRENLCTHFILPLIKLSKGSFTQSGFINSYLTRDLKRIVVKLADTILLSRSVFSHPDFAGIYKNPEGHYLIAFRIRGKWTADTALFVAGKYSRFSGKAKDRIRRYSGLQYHKKDGTQTKTDGRLLALEKHEALKRMWGQAMYTPTGKAIDDPDVYLPDEYLSVPGEETYVDLDHLSKVRETAL